MKKLQNANNNLIVLQNDDRKKKLGNVKTDNSI